MKVQIVYCHPSQRSYTYEILTQLKDSLSKHHIAFDVSDLYAMHFLSDMTEEEYLRDSQGQLSEDVLAEQKKINRADCIIFLYPVWWSDCPAKLKGWFDRVYSIGYAYSTNNSKPSEKMSDLNYGLVICTAGHHNDYLEEIGIAQSMRHVMLDDRLGNRFIKKEMIILGGTLDKEKVRPMHSNIIQSIAEKIKKYC